MNWQGDILVAESKRVVQLQTHHEVVVGALERLCLVVLEHGFDKLFSVIVEDVGVRAAGWLLGRNGEGFVQKVGGAGGFEEGGGHVLDPLHPFRERQVDPGRHEPDCTDYP